MTPPPKAPGYDEFVAAVNKLKEVICGLTLGEYGYIDTASRQHSIKLLGSLLAMWPGPGSGVSAELLAKLRAKRDEKRSVQASEHVEIQSLGFANGIQFAIDAIAAAEKQQAEKPGSELVEAVRDVLAEREKQRAKWSADHDDEHAEAEIAVVAAELAIAHAPDAAVYCPDSDHEQHVVDEWALLAKHPKTRDRLVIAAALLIAEIERLDRTALAKHAAKNNSNPKEQ